MLSWRKTEVVMISDLTVEQQYGALADEVRLGITRDALEANGIGVVVVENAQAARDTVMDIIPEGAEVMNMTSVTLQETGLADIITQSGRFNSVRNKLVSMDNKTQGREMRQLGAAADWAIGSVHAVTEDGRIFIASYSGSQMPAYVYGAGHVVWVIGTQKIVGSYDEALRRIYEYAWPLEDKRAMAAYGTHSAVNKVLVINSESTTGRIKAVLVKEKLGY
jgi:hypothetical protein